MRIQPSPCSGNTEPSPRSHQGGSPGSWFLALPTVVLRVFILGHMPAPCSISDSSPFLLPHIPWLNDLLPLYPSPLFPQVIFIYPLIIFSSVNKLCFVYSLHLPSPRPIHPAMRFQCAFCLSSKNAIMLCSNRVFHPPRFQLVPWGGGVPVSLSLSDHSE